VDPRLVPRDSVPKKSVALVTIAVQQALTACQKVSLVLFCDLFGNPSENCHSRTSVEHGKIKYTTHSCSISCDGFHSTCVRKVWNQWEF
jgi:hypothetical protein